MLAPADALADLIAATARGDRAAFRTLYDRTSGKLLGTAVRILKDRAIAEDVLQDAYLRIWQNAGAYSAASGRPMTWMITIARNRAIDFVRQRRDAVASQDAEGRDLLDSVADEQDAAGAFEEAERLRRCLDRLEPTHRDCFLDAYHQGYSREELAERYERPVNTIKTWLHRSAGALRGCLGER